VLQHAPAIAAHAQEMKRPFPAFPGRTRNCTGEKSYEGKPEPGGRALSASPA